MFKIDIKYVLSVIIIYILMNLYYNYDIKLSTNIVKDEFSQMHQFNGREMLNNIKKGSIITNKYISYNIKNVDINYLDENKRNMLFYIITSVNSDNYKEVGKILITLAENDIYIFQRDIYGNTFLYYYLKKDVDMYIHSYISKILKKYYNYEILYFEEYFLKGLFLQELINSIKPHISKV